MDSDSLDKDLINAMMNALRVIAPDYYGDRTIRMDAVFVIDRLDRIGWQIIRKPPPAPETVGVIVG